jgi:hypothetical protein
MMVVADPVFDLLLLIQNLNFALEDAGFGSERLMWGPWFEEQYYAV